MCGSCFPALVDVARNALSHIDLDADGLDDPQLPDTTSDVSVALNHIHVFTGGSIVTMKDGNPNRVASLATYDEVILAVGSVDEVAEEVGKAKESHPFARVSKRHLGEDECLFPGFIEPHCHLILSTVIGSFFINVDPLFLKSNKQEAALAALKKAPAPSGGRWMAGYGYDPSRTQDHASLSMKLLDTVSTSFPIFVINASGHIGYGNTLAFEKAGITESTKNPEGGEYVKDSQGHLTGEVREPSAMKPFTDHLTPSVKDAIGIIPSARQTLRAWSRAGCTTVFDAGIGMISNKLDIALLLAIIPPIVPHVLRYTGAFTTALAEKLNVPPPYVNHSFSVRSVKIWADGSTQGFTAALSKPYADDQGYGKLTWTDKELLAQMQPWQEKGWQLLVHSNGDAATDQVLGAYSTILGNQPDPNPNMMHRIEHATVIQRSQLQSAQKMNIGVSHLMAHVYYWGDAFRSWVLQDERAERIDPVKDDIDLGLVYSFHSDSPVSPVQPLVSARIAATRNMYQLDDLDVLGPEQRCSVIEALRGITTNAARHAMLGDQVGSLEPNKSADMVILSEDPTAIPDAEAARLSDVRIIETWYAGRKVT